MRTGDRSLLALTGAMILLEVACGLTLLLTWQALRGRPLIAPDALTPRTALTVGAVGAVVVPTTTGGPS